MRTSIAIRSLCFVDIKLQKDDLCRSYSVSSPTIPCDSLLTLLYYYMHIPSWLGLRKPTFYLFKSSRRPWSQGSFFFSFKIRIRKSELCRSCNLSTSRDNRFVTLHYSRKEIHMSSSTKSFAVEVTQCQMIFVTTEFNTKNSRRC